MLITGAILAFIGLIMIPFGFYYEKTERKVLVKVIGIILLLVGTILISVPRSEINKDLDPATADFINNYGPKLP